jgi:Major Facilitator Superfamily
MTRLRCSQSLDVAVALTLFRFCLSTMTLSIPTAVSFWQSGGLELFEIMVLQSLFSVALIIFEIPSGYLADRTSRRILLSFGAALIGCSLIAYSKMTSFWGYLACESLIALGFALISGADVALLYDELDVDGRTAEFSKKLGEIHLSESVSSITCLVVGGYLGSIDLRLPWATSGYLLLCSAVVPLLTSERSRSLSRNVPLKRSVKIALSRPVRAVILSTGIVVGCTSTMLWLYQPYLSSRDFSFAEIGWIFAGMSLVGGLGAWWGPRIFGLLDSKLVLGASATVASGTYAVLAYSSGAWSLVALVPFQMVRGLMNVASEHYLQERISSRHRATISSIRNVVQRSCYAILVTPIGWIISVLDLETAFIVIACSLGLIQLGVLKYCRAITVQQK